MKTDVTRRDFLRGSFFATAAVAGGVALAGCAPKTEAQVAGTETELSDTGLEQWMVREPVGEPEETVQADFVICGGGGCGMAALLEAHDLGLNAVLLEKKSVLGGTFAFAAAGFYPNTRYAKEAGKEVDYNDIINTIMTYNHYIPSYRLLKNFMDETPESFEWLENLGGEFRFMNADQGPFSLGVTLFYQGGTGENGTAGGMALAQVLMDEIDKRGLDVRLETPAQEIVQDENGAVTGVLATDKSGKVIKFETPAVLLCTGGWGSNPDYIRELGEVDPDRVISPGYDGRDGDGVYMARKAGAAWSRAKGTMMFYGPHMPDAPWGESLFQGIFQPTLWVDHTGARFMNEGIQNFSEYGNAIRDLKRSIIVQSQADVDMLDADGPIQGFSGCGGSGDGPQGFYKDLLAEAIDRGSDYIFKADTIEGLAEAMGVNADTFKQTVDRYNQMVAAGNDEDFQKDSVYLTPMEQGPFYGFECFDGFFTTIGGVAIDENILALDEEGNPIEGLYVAGCDTGALCGDIYDFTSAPGEQSSWAVTSGRLVAKHVADKLGA